MFLLVSHARLRARVRHPLEEMSFDSLSTASAIEMILGRMARGSNLEYGKRSKTPRQRGRARPKGERTDPCNSETVSSLPPAPCNVKSPIPLIPFPRGEGESSLEGLRPSNSRHSSRAGWWPNASHGAGTPIPPRKGCRKSRQRGGAARPRIDHSPKSEEPLSPVMQPHPPNPLPPWGRGK